MKISTAVTLAAAVTLAVVGLASFAVSARAADAEGAPPPPAVSPEKVAAVEAQVAALKAEIDYLRARDAALTSALLAHEKAAANIRAGTSEARVRGFEAAAISADSRITVLATLDMLATDLASGLPKATARELDLRRKADMLSAKAFPK